MEIDPTELPITNETEVDISSEALPFEANEGYLAAEEISHGPELLQESIKEMESLSQELALRVTADSLPVFAAEQGSLLGLSESEATDVLVAGGYAEKDQVLRNKAQMLYENFRTRLAHAAQVGVAAIAIGATPPANAETPVVIPEVTLQMSQTLEEVKTPHTYEEAKARLREATLAPAENFGLFVRKEGDDSYSPTLLKRGTSNTVPITDEDQEKLAQAMESNTADIEMVHTHPINDFSEDVGGLNDEDREVLFRGEVPRVAMSPSPVDLEGMAAQLSKYPPAQLSGRVIDPAGEWEYGIADSSAPFIEGVRNTYREIDEAKSLELTPEERAYLEKLNIENIHPGLLQREISSRAFSDPLAQSVLQKMNTMVARISEIRAKNITAEDDAKFSEFEGGLHPWIHPGTPEGDEEIARREKIASELGFRMKYTPNPITPKTENTNDAVVLRASKIIDPVNLDALVDDRPRFDADENRTWSSESLSVAPDKKEGEGS